MKMSPRNGMIKHIPLSRESDSNKKEITYGAIQLSKSYFRHSNNLP